SKSSCNTIFKKYTSHTPNEYLIRYRLDKAMELLRTTDMPIGTISMKCGFASTSYMTEQFVKCYKMTPRDFRSSKR
ncbi:MAG: helix-turn-helix transcriptional regulator, partial [Treponema sp.]|nr:helix-turn-helix transcriptional regulator [Treponema sp.]